MFESDRVNELKFQLKCQHTLAASVCKDTMSIQITATVEVFSVPLPEVVIYADSSNNLTGQVRSIMCSFMAGLASLGVGKQREMT
jgi:hypothetical protein